MIYGRTQRLVSQQYKTRILPENSTVAVY